MICEVAASVVEIAWSGDDEGPLPLEACWSTQADDGWNPNRLCAPGTLFEEINTEPARAHGRWAIASSKTLNSAGPDLSLRASTPSRRHLASNSRA